jgi:predicted small metal-binding protein
MGGGPVIKEVQCECGFYARGTEEDLVPVVQAHAKAKHGMDVTPEQVIAQLKPYDA